MSAQEDFNNFKQKLYAYQNLIKRYSEVAEDLLYKINAKQNYFNNKLTEDQRIQFFNTDSDFQQFNSIVSNLQQTYVQFYNFMNQGQSVEPDELVQKPQQVQAPDGYEHED